MADDAGYADIGSFGGEIQTPNLDALAAAGVRFTQFTASATCSPSRSMLLSGSDNHVAGVGSMAEFTAPNQVAAPGYEGYLTDRVTTVSTRLADAGYNTFMAGKWHMGEAPEQWPAARGFIRDLAPIMAGESDAVRGDSDWIGWELFGNRAVRMGNWKIVSLCAPFGTGEWQLYDVATDPGEMRDLVSAQPRILEQLSGHWNEYAAAQNVILPDRSPVCGTAN